MAITQPQLDLRPQLSGGLDVWDDGLAGTLLSNDYFQVATGGSSWTILPSGDISFVGTVSISLQKNVTILPSGNIVLSGSAPITFSNGANSVTYFPSGTVTFSGESTISHGKVFFPSGTISFSGTVVSLRGYILSPTGTLILSGTAPFVKTKLLLPSGTLFLSGSAPMSFNGSGAGTSSSKIPLTFAGTT